MKVNDSLLLSSCHFSATRKHGFNVARSSDFQENLEKLMFAWSLPSKMLCAWHTTLVRTRYGSQVTSCGPQCSLRCLNIEGRVRKLCPFLTLSMRVSVEECWVLVTQSCLTLCNPMDCSAPGSSVHAILQARILEWVAISSSRGSSWHRDPTRVSCIAGRFFTVWDTTEALSLTVCVTLEKSYCLSKTQFPHV